MSVITVASPGEATWGERRFRCAIGAGGVSGSKREGDRATPLGCFALRRALFRPDRVDAPVTAIPVVPLEPDDGWCDDPQDHRYNRAVKRGAGVRCEALWRVDSIYDVIVVLGYNDDPVVPGCGSAIFLHLGREDYGATAGCVAMALDDLLTVLSQCEPTRGCAWSANPPPTSPARRRRAAVRCNSGPGASCARPLLPPRPRAPKTRRRAPARGWRRRCPAQS